MPSIFDYAALIGNRSPDFQRDSIDWLEWRYIYEGGHSFSSRYLEPFSDRESMADFDRRRRLTPIPTYAKREVNRIKNALFQRFSDILRRGGSQELQDAYEGNGAGVDNKGCGMNTFMGKYILPELLPMGKVGVLIDAPRFNGGTLYDQPEGFRPYIYTYPVERIPILIEAENGHPSDFQAVLIFDRIRKSNFQNGSYTETLKYRYYYIEDDSDFVKIQHLDMDGNPTENVIVTGLTEIPFVLYDIGDSLIKDVAQHQIALLNLISSDTSYAIDANFPFLTRQRGNANVGAHLKGENADVTTGVKKGLFYDKALERPGFISPPTEPMKASLELRKELKDEVRDLVGSALCDLSEDGSIDSGLAFIGLMLEYGENRCWDHWTAYENRDPARREKPTIRYPEHWCLKPEKERIEDANELAATMYKVPGRKVKKELSKLVADKLLRGRVSTEVLDEISREIDEAAYCTSDPDIVIPAKKHGLMSGKTATMALGGDETEWIKAEEDQAKRVAAIVAAQSDAAGARGNPDGSVDSASAELDKEGSADDPSKLGGEGRTVRGARISANKYDGDKYDGS